MNELDEQGDVACQAECSQCSGRAAGDASSKPGGLTGWRFALVAVVAFAIPMGLSAAAAIAVGLVFDESAGQTQQLLAALAGLVLGIVVARLVLGRIRPPQGRQGQ